VMDRPTMPGCAFVAGGFGVIALPWADKSHLVSQLEATVEAENTRLMTIEAVENLLIGLRAEAARLRSEGLIPVLVSHLMVAGSVTSTGQVMQGIGIELTPYAIQEIGCEYAALGHVHAHQSWFDGRVSYSGSPVRQNFGEGERKGYNLVTFDDEGKFVSNEFRPLPAREIVLIEADWTGDRASQLDGGVLQMGMDDQEIKWALVRFRYRIDAANLHLANDDDFRGILLQEGAAEVKVEAVVVHGNRIRSEAIVTATSTKEKVLAYLASKGETLTEEAMARLEQNLAAIEQEGA